MKNGLLTVVFVVAVAAWATPAPAPPQQGKQINDPAEYNAYIIAYQQQNPAAKIGALEALLGQYPNSVVRQDALELLMGAYQQSGNQAKTVETAQRELQSDPCNLRALVLVSYADRALAEAGHAPDQNLAEAGKYGEKGAGVPADRW